MICLDDTDTLEAWSGTDAVVDYAVHGLVGTTFTQLAAGLLGNVADVAIYTAEAATSVVSIIFVNTDTSAATINFRLDPADAGNPRYQISKAVSLGPGYSLHTDGARCTVLDTDGQIIHGYPSPLGPTKGGTGLATYTKGDLLHASATNVLAALGIGTANYKAFTNAAGDLPEWAVGIKLGVFTKDANDPSGTQEISGVGFKLSHVIFLTAVENEASFSVGFDDGSARCNMAMESAAKWETTPSTYSLFMNQPAAGLYRGKITTVGSDGFTITWTRTNTPTWSIDIFYLAFR